MRTRVVLATGVSAIAIAIAIGVFVMRPRHAANGVRVLFVGNSFTYFNDMPKMITRLVDAAHEARPFEPTVVASAGFHFSDHCQRSDAPERIAEGGWQYVVLQEGSAGLSFSPAVRATNVTPFARELAARVHGAGAQALLYETWPYRDGDYENIPTDSYDGMRHRLDEGFADLARDLSAPLVPVGVAWHAVHVAHPEIVLWTKDGHHPTEAGSYLAACTFYAFIYGARVIGDPYVAGLSTSDALVLQRAASDAVARVTSNATDR